MRAVTLIAGAVPRATLSFAYWLLVFFLFYGAVAGDRRGYGEMPSFWQTWTVPMLIVAGAILSHAAVLIAWERRSRSGPPGSTMIRLVDAISV